MAQLPLYHSTSGRLQYAAGRKGFSFKDRHLLLIILAVFAIICIGSLYYAPEVMEQVSFDTTYRRFIGLQDEANVIVSDDAVMDDQVSPSKIPPNKEKTADDDKVVHNDPDDELKNVGDKQDTDNVDVRRDSDEQKEQKEQNEPEITKHEDNNKEEVVGDMDNNKDNVNVENKNSDPLVAQRRDKVKEVYIHTCIFIYLYVNML